VDGGSGGGDVSWAVAVVTPDAPAVYFSYTRDCPDPIITNGADRCQSYRSDDPSRGTDIHNPVFGQIIVERYEALGIGDRITLEDGLAISGNGKFDNFDNFVTNLREKAVTESVDLEGETCGFHGAGCGEGETCFCGRRRMREYKKKKLRAMASERRRLFGFGEHEHGNRDDCSCVSDA